MYLTTNPKAIPHKPCSSVKQTTHTIGPSAKKILRKICNNKCKTFYKLLSNHEKKLVHGPIIQVNLTEKIPITEMEMKTCPKGFGLKLAKLGLKIPLHIKVKQKLSQAEPS